MATLTNTQISVTYVGLLKTSANTVLSSTAQQITDGSGNNSILFLSTAGVGIGGAAASGKELDVTGNVQISGDLIIDNIKIDGNTISAESGVVTLANGAIATTQSQNDNSTKIATTAYVDTAIDGVDTLAEILANGNTTGATNIVVQKSIQLPTTTTNTGTPTDQGVISFGGNHTNGNRIFNDAAGGTLRIQGSDNLQIFAPNFLVENSNGNLISAGDTGVRLFYQGSEKLQTSSTGVSVTGNIVSQTTSGNSGIKVITANDAEGFLIFGDPDDNSMGGMAYNNATNTLDIDCNNAVALSFDSSRNATFSGNVDVNGTEITVGTNNSIFSENNIRFKSTGGAFIDHNTTGQSISFRTSVSSSLDTTPLVLSGANATFVGTLKSDTDFVIQVDADNNTTGSVFKILGGGGSELFRVNENTTVGINTTDTSAYNSRGQNLVVNSSGDTGITIAAGSSDSSTLLFADGTGGTAAYRGTIEYDHADDSMAFSTAAVETLSLNSDQSATFKGNINLLDAKKIKLGAAPDFEIFHNNTSNVNVITSLLSRQMNIQSDTLNITNQDASTTYLGFASGGAATFAGDVTATSKKFISTSSSSGDYVRLYAGSGTAQWDIYGNGENLRLSENSSGGGIFQVDSGASFAGQLTVDYSTADAVIRLAKGSSTIGNIDFVNEGNRFSIQDDGTRRLVIDTSGNFGLGTASPRNTTNHTSLTVNGSSVGRLDLATSDTIRASFYAVSSQVGIQTEADIPLIFGTGTSSTTALTLDSSQNATFAGHGLFTGSTGDAPSGSGTFVGLTNNYANLQLNGSNGAHIDFSTSGVDYKGRIIYFNSSNSLAFYTNAAGALTLDSSQNAIFTGNITSTGTSITLDSAGSADYIADRLNDTSGATYQYKTNGSLKWYHGLRGLSNNDFYLFNNTASANALVITESGSNATFAGDITIGGKTYPKLNLTDNQGVARNFSVGTNNETFTVRNETGSADVFTIAGADNAATFAGDVTINGGIIPRYYNVNIDSAGGTSSTSNVYLLGRLTLSQSNGCIIKVLGTVSFGAGNDTSGVTYIHIRGNNGATTLDGHFYGFNNNSNRNTIEQVRYVNISSNVFDIYIKYDGTFAGLDTIVETGGIFVPNLTDQGSTSFPTSVAFTSKFAATTAGVQRFSIDNTGNTTFAGDVALTGSGDKIVSAISSDDDATLFLSGAGSGKDTHIVFGGDRDLFISKSSSATATSEGTPVLTLGSNSNATFAGRVQGTNFNSIENSTNGGFTDTRDYLLAGTGDRGGALVINDVSGARHAIIAGGFDLTFAKETDNGAGTKQRDVYMRANASNAAGIVTSVDIFRDTNIGGSVTITQNSGSLEFSNTGSGHGSITTGSSKDLNIGSGSGNVFINNNTTLSGDVQIGSSGTANLYLGNTISASSADRGMRLHTNNADFFFDFQGDAVNQLFFRDYDGSGGIHTRHEFRIDNGSITISGSLTQNGSPSDIKYKENIKTISNGIDKIEKLNPVEFDWNDKSDAHKIGKKEDAGFIAQEVQKVLPNLVNQNVDGDLALNYEGIIPYLVQSIQELKKEIEILKSK